MIKPRSDCSYALGMPHTLALNTLRPRQNGRHFPDDIFKCISLYQNVWISIKISLKFVPQVQINNIPALFQIMAWRRLGDKPLSETMMVRLLTHICVTRPQWVNTLTRGASVNGVIIGSGNGLSPVRLQAITRNNNNLMPVATLGRNCHWTLNENTTPAFHENAF